MSVGLPSLLPPEPCTQRCPRYTKGWLQRLATAKSFHSFQIFILWPRQLKRGQEIGEVQVMLCPSLATTAPLQVLVTLCSVINTMRFNVTAF